MRPPPGLMSGQSFLTSSSHAFRMRCRFSFPPAASSGDGSAWLELSFGSTFSGSAEYALPGPQGLAQINSVATIAVSGSVVGQNGFVIQSPEFGGQGATYHSSSHPARCSWDKAYTIMDKVMRISRRTILKATGLGALLGMTGGCDAVGGVFGRMFA